MSISILKEHKVKDIKGIHLFGSNGSNNFLRAALMLEEKKLKWEAHSVNLLKYENFETEYLEINPQGSIPAMIHDGIAIYGSENILKYLEKVFPFPSLIPNGKEAEMWEWVESATRTHMETAIGYLYSKKGGRPLRKDMVDIYKKRNPEKLKFMQERGYHMTSDQIQEVLNINNAKMLMLEERLNASDYILGNNLSVADISWFPDVIFIEAIGFDLFHYPNVRKWVNRIKELPLYNKRTKFPALLINVFMHYLRMISKSNKYLK